VQEAAITRFHAKYFAHELTKRCASDSIQKLAASLADAQVDLNPHQIDAALFAFRSPLSRGAILADEVGLGKTIEAGILLSQKWAERKRKLLVIVPANLRKQWNQELTDKFFLPSVILEKRTFKEQIRSGNLNPFSQPETIIICSYHFARPNDAYIRQVDWDLVVIDEAHRLRNVYKPTNRIANAIKNAVAPFPKVLLTATPLQNSLLELFGLVSVIDDYTFGDLKSFKSQFANLTSPKDFADLKARLKPICQRTLRRQVLEYVPFTNRHALVQEFYPTPEEQRLYDLVSDYLQRPTLFALPASQRKLMTLILRRLGTLRAAFAREHGLQVRELDSKFGSKLDQKLTEFVIAHRTRVVQPALVRPEDINADASRAALVQSEANPDAVTKSPREERYFLNGKQLLFYASKTQVIDGKLTTAGLATTIWDDLFSNNIHKEGGVSFPNGKKPEALLKRVLELATKPGDWVLDSFAGSGTTGAVAHKMGRRWIMVELGEHCDTHIVPRLQSVVNGTDESGITQAVAWNGGGGFRYFHLAPSLLKTDKWGNLVLCNTLHFVC
jgi:SNF2-related domain/DNA methylase